MSTSTISLKAEARGALGKSAARRLRASGQVPAIAYGKGVATTTLAVAPKEVLSILKSERGKNSLIDLDLGAGKKLSAMIRDYTYHPIHRTLEHVDFVEVKLDQPVDVEVPLFWTGKPAGVVLGGVLRQVYRTVPVRCVPEKIPVKLEIDVTHLKLNEHVATRDLVLGDGVSVRLPAEQTLIAVVAPEKERPEDVVAVTPGAAAAAGGAAAGAAPAAGGAAPAAAAAAPAKDAKKK